MTAKKVNNIDTLFRSLEKEKEYTQKELRRMCHDDLGVHENVFIAQIMRFTLAHMEQLENFKYRKK